MMRTGVVARKIGMTRIFTEEGVHIPVTVLDMADCTVIAHKTPQRDGYCALQLGSGAARLQRVDKPMRGLFASAGVAPKQRLVEFRVDEADLVPVGGVLQADHFVPGQKVDVAGISRGKGFAGAMKRHNFSGLRATHGVSVSHRSHGATGSCQEPGRVWKGKKMAGHMGSVRVTTQNLDIVSVDSGRGLILVRGAIPGAPGGWVLVRDAVKSGFNGKDLPHPAAFHLPENHEAENHGAESETVAASHEETDHES